MLTHLQIRDLAIVDSVELEWSAGFTALTGETGAGKSVLVDALLLATGGRADSGAIRAGAERAEVSATFDVSRNSAARHWLEEQSIAHEGECILRRVVTADGRGRAYVNGQTVPAQSLRALGERLVDIHGQLEFQSLVRRTEQRALLDASAGLQSEAAAVAQAYREWRELDSERRNLEARLRDRDSRLELLAHYVRELDGLALAPGEPESLQSERRRYAALGKLAEGTTLALQLLGVDDDGATSALARAQSQLKTLVSLDSGLAAAERSIEEALIACREAGSDLRRYVETLDADPARQDWLESRLAALETAARKHRVEVAALPALRESLRNELDQLSSLSESRAELDRRCDAADRIYRAAAAALGEARRRSALALDARVTQLMQELGMAGGVFATRVSPNDPLAYSPHGNDEVEFLVTANAGQPPRPLARVASGGELSRISLALQVATLDTAHLPCLVFDEVDAGIGGAVAEKVGRMLAQLAASAQVLCVTHLPQVAAQATHQVRVEKTVRGGRTSTSLERLTPDGRVDEIARMLGGSTITERTREHAREMLEHACGPALSRRKRRPISQPSRGTGSSRARSGRAESANDR